MGPEEKDSYFINSDSLDTNIFKIDKDNVFDLIREKWENENLDELVEIIDELRTLADKLRNIETTSEVSPYIYAMY